MSEEKMEAFAEHILTECVKEGFTIAEVRQIPNVLKFEIEDQVSRILDTTMFSC